MDEKKEVGNGVEARSMALRMGHYKNARKKLMDDTLLYRGAVADFLRGGESETVLYNRLHDCAMRLVLDCTIIKAEAIAVLALAGIDVDGVDDICKCADEVVYGLEIEGSCYG